MNIRNMIIWIVLLFLWLVGCAGHIPKEVVELSYRTGEDISELSTSYDKLIHEFYEQLRAQRINYLEEQWIPEFIERWIKNGRLIDVAKGEVVWSEDEAKFVEAPPVGAKQQLFATVRTWADEAVYQIEAKKAKLIEPLNTEEDALRKDVADAFRQLMRANATITAHLNSLREVQEVQDQALQALQIKDLRDNINKALVTASDKAALGLEKIKKADAELRKLKRN